MGYREGGQEGREGEGEGEQRVGERKGGRGGWGMLRKGDEERGKLNSIFFRIQRM